jgi:hypothetical protein
MIGPISVPRPPTAVQIDHFDRVGRREFTGIDDADLRHVERAGNARHHGRDVKAKSLTFSTR